jgi:hypothetical protein
MIKLHPNPSFKFRVEVAIPGAVDPARFVLVGRHMTQTDLRAWGERAKAMEGQDAEFLLSAVEGWEEVVDADGKAVKFSPEAFGALLESYPGASLQIFQSYIRELSAGRTKN